MAFGQNARRAVVPALTDHPARIPLQFKLIATELNQDLQQIAYEVEGAQSTLYVNSLECHKDTSDISHTNSTFPKYSF